MASGALFSVTSDGSQLAAVLNGIRLSADRDLSAAMSIIAEDLVTAVSDEFDSAGNGKWPGLAESTLRKRRLEGRGAQILQDTGRFAASIAPDAGALFAEASTDVEYAVYHVSDAPRRVIPLRNPFDLGDDIWEEAAKTILEEMRL